MRKDKGGRTEVEVVQNSEGGQWRKDRVEVAEEYGEQARKDRG